MSPSLISPVLLALDTATDRVHLALVSPPRATEAGAAARIRTRDLPGGAQASATLLPALQALLDEAGLVWSDVSALAFGSGPGAFTGLRTACAITQGLALGLARPVLVLDTLMAVAEAARLQAPQAWRAGDILWVLQDARMAEFYVAAYRWDGHQWHLEVPAALWPMDEPRRRWVHDTDRLRVCGNALRACADAFAGLLPPALALQPAPGPDAPVGLALANLAQQAWQQGQGVDAALALPRYVRDKVAQTTAERMERRAGGGAPHAPHAPHAPPASALAVQLRPLVPQDIPAIVALERDACAHPLHAWTEVNYDTSLRAGYWTLVATQPGSDAPCAVCVAMNGVEEVHLLNIAVARNCHGRGVAQALLQALYAHCHHVQARALWLEVRPSNERARALYRREGFSDIGVRRHYYPAESGREDAWVMRRDLAPEVPHALD